MGACTLLFTGSAGDAQDGQGGGAPSVKEKRAGALGESLAAVGDLNGDGLMDIAAGAPQACPDRIYGAGQFLLLSGRDGTTLHAVNGTALLGSLGRSVSGCPDLDGDAIQDVLVGAYVGPQPCPRSKFCYGGPGEVRVYSGKDCRFLYSVQSEEKQDGFGNVLTGLRDLDGDGLGDFAVGVPLVGKRASPELLPPGGKPVDGTRTVGEVRVFSGKSGRLLYSIPAPKGSEWEYMSLAAMDDVNADGRPELAIGVAKMDRVLVCSGSDGSTLRTIHDSTEGLAFGESVASISDLDGDGRRDLVIGARSSGRGDRAEPGRAFAYSTGKDWKRLLEIREPSPKADSDSWFGSAVGAAKDVDGDGVPEVLVGACADGVADARLAGRVHVFSGKDGRLIRSVAGGKLDRSGHALVGGGDLDGDGHGDFVASSRWARGEGAWGAGEVTAFSGASGEKLWRVKGQLWESQPPD